MHIKKKDIHNTHTHTHTHTDTHIYFLLHTQCLFFPCRPCGGNCGVKTRLSFFSSLFRGVALFTWPCLIPPAPFLMHFSEVTQQTLCSNASKRLFRAPRINSSC